MDNKVECAVLDVTVGRGVITVRSDGETEDELSDKKTALSFGFEDR